MTSVGGRVFLFLWYADGVLRLWRGLLMLALVFRDPPLEVVFYVLVGVCGG